MILHALWINTFFLQKSSMVFSPPSLAPPPPGLAKDHTFSHFFFELFPKIVFPFATFWCKRVTDGQILSDSSKQPLLCYLMHFCHCPSEHLLPICNFPFSLRPVSNETFHNFWKISSIKPFC